MTSSEEFNCIFCKESFQNKEDLQVHFRKHGDPKFNQSVKNSKGKSPNEMAASGEKSEETEMVQCDVCMEEFPTISKAITHKHKVHPDHDAKYFCPWCGKLFTMKHLYNKHIQSVHESKEECGGMGFHCDYCEVDFFVPSAMLYHNKFFHRQDTELAAIGHSRKLKLCNQEPLQIYYCPFCGEEYCNKVNLHKHMGDDHIDENQSPEDVLRCPLCDAVFYHLDAYELHLTFHSTEDMYGEENEMAKELTEFSLETVPPLMEKVENEFQEDESATTLGIEELLQQAMNESNGETGREKKKKHKKHKKSKKAAITLDEFLNMNSDVFGEGLDVEGIVEVPTQVVAKSLKRKPGPKPLPTELQKLKKAGLVIKKNPTSMAGAKILNKKPTLRPGVKIAQGNIIKNKLKAAAIASSTKPASISNDASSTTNDDVLNRLLNQGNGQIKIVKKSTQGNSSANLPVTKEELPERNDSENDPEIDGNVPSKDEDSKVKANPNQSASDNEPEVEEDGTEVHIDDNNKTAKTQDPNSNINKYGNNPDNLDESVNQETLGPPNVSDDQNIDDRVNESNPAINNTDSHKKITDTLGALRNISQHLTIKSFSSQNKEPKSNLVKEIDNRLEKGEEDDTNKLEDTKSMQNETYFSSQKADDSNKLNSIKHLSHLTIKHVSQANNASSPVEKNVLGETENYEDMRSMRTDGTDELCEEKGNNQTEDDYIFTKEQPVTQNQAITLDALKNVSKNITIKPISQTINSPKKNFEKPSVDQTEDRGLSPHNTEFENHTALGKKPISKVSQNIPSVTQNVARSPPVQPSLVNKVQTGNKNQSPKDTAIAALKNEIAANFTKSLPNITAKPVNTQKGNFVQNSVKKTENKQDDIEIFNIDDSDDEPPTSPVPKSPSIQVKQNCPKYVLNKDADNKKLNDKCKDVLKNLSKHITIKPSNQGTPTKESNEESYADEDPAGDLGVDFKDNSLEKNSLQQTATALQSKLKSLNTLTVKSRNTSPKLSVAPKVNVNNLEINEYDSDCSNTPEKVKITELPDDYTSDDDAPLQNIKTSNLSKKIEDHVDTDVEVEDKAHTDDDDDIESKITSTTLTRPTPQTNKPAILNNLKNITVKSSQANRIQEEGESPDSSDENKVLVPYQPPNKNHSTTLPFHAGSSHTQGLGPSCHLKQNIGRTVKQQTSNRVNTVNKEVTVQKFQTKTVVQEITTTVTKTIRTINQTVKQEVRNVSQGSSMPMTPQKVQGIRPQIRNFKGTPTRPTAPQIGTKIRNVPPSRPPGINNIRAPNQLVPVRPGVNLARPSNPRMAGPKSFKESLASTSNDSNSSGKPLKISANAKLNFNKRQATDAVSGPFSCFKKPKESLIPSVDEGDTGMFASASQMTQSNFSSTTKIMKGNSMMTSTQMKSQMSASSKQISRLNSMEGLKVVKSSQSKQVSKIEEKTEVSPAKRSALEAIEKLQKQGLLVKKPKAEEPIVEEPEDSDHEQPYTEEGDDYYDT